MMIDIPNDVASRLQGLAEERGCSIGELLENLLDRGATESGGANPGNTVARERKDASLKVAPADDDDADWPPPGSLAALALNAHKANLGGGKFTDTAARSREILKAEFPDYIRRHQAE
ncbi:MAG: hypothetical protein OXI34_03240 [Chloroflexota bacterium]|nr:hypothetical protein [Chloroflexota bacterium]MDE2947784.1 hypothetical protein [Chloroflexota bacterium]